MATRQRLFLIDGTALAYRSFFAFAMSPRGGLTTHSGHPTSATFGFTMTLRAILEREKPDFIAAAFDGPREELERTALFPEYKSTREKAPDELLEQLDDVQRVVQAYGIPIAVSKGHEADDVIGTLAVQGRDAGMDVFIVTADKDFMQLVGDHVKLWNLKSSAADPEILDSDSVRKKFGVGPDQMIDLLALMGDSSDNVPGVPRVGQKTASKLIEEFGSLDAAYEHLDEVKPPSIQKALRENREQALLSRDLVTIRTDVPIDHSATDLPRQQADPEALRALFQELEFESLLKSLPGKQDPSIAQDYRLIRDAKALDELLDRLRAAGRFAVDTETTSLDPMVAELVGVSFCAEAGEAFYVPFNLEPPVLSGGRDALVAALRPLLEDPELKKTGQNAKYDLHVFLNADIEVQGLEFDTMLASYRVSAGLGSHGLDALALREFDYKKIETKELLGTGKKQKTFDQVDIDLAGRYAAEDADFTWRLRERFEPRLAQEAVEAVFRDIEMPLVPVLLAMEREGIRIDVGHLERLSAQLGSRIAEAEQRIYERAGEPFNLNAPAQIGEVLFDRLEVHRAAGMKPRKTRTGQDQTTADILEKLAEHHEVPRLILEYRQLTKLKSTYVDSLPRMVNARTGRVHTSFNQAVAATGRLSSDNPNLQNIPIRSEWGREVRRGVRRAGRRLGAAVRRLQPDRAPHPRARRARRGIDRSVPEARGHPYADGGPRARSPAGHGDAGDAIAGEGDQLRPRLWHGCVAARGGDRDDAGRGAQVHRRGTSRRSHACAAGSTRRSTRRGANRSVRDDLRSPAQAAGDRLVQPRHARAGREHGREHADPGHRRRHHQARDARRAPGARPPRPEEPHAAAGPRRARARRSEGRADRGLTAPARGDGGCGRSGGAARGHARLGSDLARCALSRSGRAARRSSPPEGTRTVEIWCGWPTHGLAGATLLVSPVASIEFKPRCSKRRIMLTLRSLVVALAVLTASLGAQERLVELRKQVLPVPYATFADGATVPLDIDGDGDLDLFVGARPVFYYGRWNGGQSRLYRNDGRGEFTDVTASQLPAGFIDIVEDVAAGDIDSDGDIDLVIATAIDLILPSTGQTRLLLNNGSGTFTEATASRLPVDGDSSLAIAFGDVDGDGLLDLVLGNQGSVKLYRNTGNGVMQDVTAGRVPQPITFAVDVELQDVDGDGDLDMLVVNHGSAAFTKLFLNDGSGTFSDNTSAAGLTGIGTATDAELVDSDADGDLDLVLADVHGLRVFSNGGSGTFTEVAGVSPSPSGPPLAIRAADVDGDGDPDVVFEGEQGLGIYANDGTGGFQDVSATTLDWRYSDYGLYGGEFGTLVVADLDGRGGPDVYFGTQATIWHNGLYGVADERLFLNDGQGVFEDLQRSAFGGARGSIELGDIDGDGALDAIAFGAEDRLFRNDGGGRFTDISAGNLPAGSGTSAVVFRDFDGDGDVDVALGRPKDVASSSANDVLLLNDGTGRFSLSPGALPANNFRTFDLAAGDVDGDGDQDLVVGVASSTGRSDTNRLWLNDGSGRFTDATATNVGANNASGYRVELGDLDGDGDLDLYQPNSPQNRILRNDGTGRFSPAGNPITAGVAENAVLADLDRDGDLDIVEVYFFASNTNTVVYRESRRPRLQPDPAPARQSRLADRCGRHRRGWRPGSRGRDGHPLLALREHGRNAVPRGRLLVVEVPARPRQCTVRGRRRRRRLGPRRWNGTRGGTSDHQPLPAAREPGPTHHRVRPRAPLSLPSPAWEWVSDPRLPRLQPRNGAHADSGCRRARPRAERTHRPTGDDRRSDDRRVDIARAAPDDTGPRRVPRREPGAVLRSERHPARRPVDLLRRSDPLGRERARDDAQPPDEGLGRVPSLATANPHAP